MSDTPTSGDGAGTPPLHAEPDAHGQAALLLAESILHALVETSTLSNAEAVAVVRTAVEVKSEIAELSEESADTSRESLDLLRAIEKSLDADS